jgi:hypothetical protein
MRPKIYDLPEECVREIILRITDHKDLEASASAWSLMAALISEQRVWRELSHYHFTEQQINAILEKMCLIDTKERHRNWQAIYHSLRKYVKGYQYVCIECITSIFFLFTELMVSGRIYSTWKYWRSAAFVAASFGQWVDIRVLLINIQTSKLAWPKLERVWKLNLLLQPNFWSISLCKLYNAMWSFKMVNSLVVIRDYSIWMNWSAMRIAKTYIIW